MPISRRRFTVATSCAVTLTVLGCDGRWGQADTRASESSATDLVKAKDEKDDPRPKSSKLAKEPFLIGPPARYKNAGVYTDHKEQGVWIVSDGRALVVLNATCTHLACATKLDLPNGYFICPCHESRFSFQGIHKRGSKAKRPLERCALGMVEGQIQVDPTRRFREEKGQWSDPASLLVLS